MKIFQLPVASKAEADHLERNCFEFISEIRILSAKYGLAFRVCDGLCKFDPAHFQVRYDMDETGRLMASFEERSD